MVCRIQLHTARNLQHIAHPARDAGAGEPLIVTGQIIARPHQSVVRELRAPAQDFLSDKTALVTMREMEAVFITLGLSFSATPTLVIGRECRT